MAKRLVETEIWKKQRWFRKLDPIYKLIFLYIKDQCDHAGIWNSSVLDLIDDIGLENVDIDDFLLKCNSDFDKKTGALMGRERLVALPDGSIWITGFCQFQYEGKDKKIHPGNASISAIYKLHSLGLAEKAIENKHISLSIPLEPFLRGKDKDKDKDKDNLNANKNKNGKSSGNFKAQGEELFAARLAKRV